MHPRDVRLPRTVLCLTLLFAVAMAAGLAVAPQPTAAQRPVEFVLNPSADTYLGDSNARDDAEKLLAGWVYAARPREHRAYVSFPLDPELHPPAGLRRAELLLYPAERPDTSTLLSVFRVRRMMEPLAPGRKATNWFLASGDGVERQLAKDSTDWKKWTVTELVLEMLQNPDEAYGFEIAGTEPQDDTRWAFMSSEGGGAPYPDGQQPHLIMQFQADAFPSPTSDATRTPKPTVTPSVTPTYPTPTPSATPLPMVTSAPDPAYVPRADNG